MKLFARLTNNKIQYLLLSLLILLFCASVPAVQAQVTVTALTTNPTTSLAFGIATGTAAVPPAVLPASTTQAVTVNMTGSGSVTFSPASFLTGSSSSIVAWPPGVTSSWPNISYPTSAFAVTANTCLNPSTSPPNTFTAPTTCTVTLNFSSASATPNPLQVADLVISYTVSDGEPSSITVPLSGAYGAIGLATATTVQPSNPSAGFGSSLYTFGGGAPLILSCPAVGTATATISGTPDGLGNLQVDNYVVLDIDGSPVTTYLSSDNNSAVYPGGYTGSPTAVSAYPAGNVCYNNDANGLSPIAYSDNPSVGIYYPECFSEAYRDNVSSLVGVGTDLIANPNATLSGYAGGVQPLNVSTFITELSPQVTVSLVDAGGYYENSTLFLVTNCSSVGQAPGATATGSPVPTQPSQTLVLDAVQPMSYTVSDAICAAQGTCTLPNALPIAKNFGISQASFQNLVSGTTAGPDACLLITGEVNPSSPGTLLCKGWQIQCLDQNKADTTYGTVSGDNCGTSTARNLYDAVSYSSPDTPLPANFDNQFYNSCASYVMATQSIPNGTCALSSSPSMNPTTLMGIAFLTFADSPEGPVCQFPSSSSIFGDLCPLNTLTQFKGAADGGPGSSTVPTRQSIGVVAVNHPLAFTTINSTSPTLTNGWINSDSLTVNLTANQATYLPSPQPGVHPLPNTWTPSKPYSWTYGLSPAYQPIPDSTIPLKTDTTLWSPGVNPGFAAPICPTTYTATSFTPSPSPIITVTSDGIYNLHYYTTGCDYSVELYFNPSSAQLSDPTANWAAYPVLPFGVDTTNPTLSCTQSPSSAVYNGWYNSNVTQECSASDAGSGIGSIDGTAQTLTPNTTNNPGYSGFVGTVMQGPPNTAYNVSTTVSSGTALSCNLPSTPINAACIGQQTVTDVAGNTTTYGPAGGWSYMIDLQAPVIGGPTLSASNNYNVPPLTETNTLTVTYSCNDQAGSGVASCSGQVTPALSTSTSCTQVTTELWKCTSLMTVTPTTSTGTYTFNVSSADNVMNCSSTASPPLPAISGCVSPGTSSSPATFKIGYASASVLTGSGFWPTSGGLGSNLIYLAGAIDASPTSNPTSVYGATITLTFTIPTNSLASGNATAGFWDINCAASNFPGCLAPPTTGTTPCSASPTAVSGSTTSLTFICSVGNLADAATSKTGVGLMVVMPISKTAPAGTITSNAVIKAASPLTGITSSSASVKIK